MGRTQKTLIWIAAGVVVTGVAVRISTWRASKRPVILTGAVIRADPNSMKQIPVSNVTVTAIGSPFDDRTKSDAAGLFRLTVHPGLLPGPPITLKFEHAEYQPFEIFAPSKDLLYVVRMQPIASPPVADHTETLAKVIQIKNVRVHYSVKNQTTITVGSVAKEFEVKNQADVPCKGQHPCSPDGKWKAAAGNLTLDADKGNEFRNVRASCIAGPCPFTRIEPSDLSVPAQRIDITALNWSDTTGFLVEAEVTRTVASNKVLQSYPFVTGQTMSFALPGTAEGPSVVADLNAEEIVFPLGPKMILSWATCSVEVAAGGNKIYRCELKPGYQFQQ